MIWAVGQNIINVVGLTIQFGITVFCCLQYVHMTLEAFILKEETLCFLLQPKFLFYDLHMSSYVFMDQNVPENYRNLVFYGDAHPNFGHKWTCNCNANTVPLRYLKHILECQSGMVKTLEKVHWCQLIIFL